MSNTAAWDATTRLVHAGDSAAAREGLAVKGANPAVQRASMNSVQVDCAT